MHKHTHAHTPNKMEIELINDGFGPPRGSTEGNDDDEGEDEDKDEDGSEEDDDANKQAELLQLDGTEIGNTDAAKSR